MLIQSRRNFITGLVSALIAAPAIVRAGSLMPVKMYDQIMLDDNYLEQDKILARLVRDFYEVVNELTGVHSAMLGIK